MMPSTRSSHGASECCGWGIIRLGGLPFPLQKYCVLWRGVSGGFGGAWGEVLANMVWVLCPHHRHSNQNHQSLVFFFCDFLQKWGLCFCSLLPLLRRHDGEPWPDNADAGQVLQRGVLAGMRGDWDYFFKQLHLPYWKSQRMCWWCTQSPDHIDRGEGEPLSSQAVLNGRWARTRLSLLSLGFLQLTLA